MYWACTHFQKRQLFRQRQLNHKGMGEGDYGTQRRTAKPFQLAGLSLLKGSTYSIQIIYLTHSII